MSGELTLFESGDWSVRTVVVDGEPWFVAADVADARGLGRHQDSTRHLDDDEKRVCPVDTPSGTQQMTVLSEAGLYSLILRSRVDAAKSFKRWITHDVIPAIRRTGAYTTVPALPESMLDQFELAVQGWRAAETRAEIAEAKVEEIAPAANAWAALAEDGADWDVRTVAQLLSRDPAIKIGQNRLMAHLREVKWIDQWNNPYQAQVDNGRLNRKHGSWTDDRNIVHATVSTRVTVKGVEALHKQLGGAAPVAFPLAVVS